MIGIKHHSLVVINKFGEKLIESYTIDDHEYPGKDCTIKTRVSGNMRIIELYGNADHLFCVLK